MPAPRFEKIKKILSQRQPDLTVLLEGVEKPHNLAAIARTCDAVGIAEIHAVTSVKGLKLSQKAAGGIRKWLDLVRHPSTDDAFAHFKSRNMQLVVTHLSDNTIDYKEIDYTKPTVIIAGSEDQGVSDYAVSHADHCIALPMLGMVQSLNVSVAMSVILYEALKQRQQAGMYKTKRLPAEQYEQKLFEWSQPKITQLCKETRQGYPQLDSDGQLINKDQTE